MLEGNPILSSISQWFERHFSDPSAVSLFMTLVLGLLFFEFLGQLFMPILVSVLLAYLLQGLVRVLDRWHSPHMVSVLLVYLVFLSLLIYILFALMPMLWRQLGNLVQELPQAFSKSQVWLEKLTQYHPRLFSGAQWQHSIEMLRTQIAQAGQLVLKYSLATIPNVIQIVLYLVLVPLLVFFFLKDGKMIVSWGEQYLPSHRSLVSSVFSEVHEKIGCYVRGRVIEIAIVGSVSAIAFAFLQLQYAILLGALVGLSVIIPYVGAVVVTIPIVIIGLMQWGFTTDFTYLMVIYFVIMLLDANVIVPLLFSETMDLHPIAIIAAVVVFGGIWGVWGVFFAIPLATLVNAVLKAWPSD